MQSHNSHQNLTVLMEQYYKHHKSRRRRRANDNPLKKDTRFVRTYPSSNLINKSTLIKESTRAHKIIPSSSSSSSSTKLLSIIHIFVFICLQRLIFPAVECQQNFLTPNTQSYLIPGHNMENFRIPEIQMVDSIVYQLKAVDRLNENRKFSYHMTGDTFQVDEMTGEVRLVKPLDRERQAQIVVIISVFDISDLKNDAPVESKRRTITVEDIDDSWPVFATNKYSLPPTIMTHSPPNTIGGHHSTSSSSAQLSYQVELSEQAAIGSIVLGEIQVSDADEGPNAELVFECRPKQSSQSACDMFSIESRRLNSGKYSVSLRTKAQLDYETIQSYKLSLVARGRRPSPLKGVPLETEAVINIQLINVQDEGPMFVNAPYSLSMPENIRPGTRLLSMIVQDGDASPQRDLSMIVVPTGSLYSKYFQVSKDPEHSKLWYLETSNVTIDREDSLINEMGNMFTISLLAAELDDSGTNPVANGSELQQAFRDPNYSKGTLKRENVTIVILDQPDSRPIFVQASTGLPLQLKDNVLVLNISESISTGSSVPNLDLAVIDLDQGMNSRFNLSLIDPDIGPLASSAFSLEPKIVYGRAEIVLNVLNDSLLDFEDPSLRSYHFNLVASKSNSPDLIQMLELQVNIQDANDNAPEFDRDQYVLEVAEGALPETVVGIIQAKDRDSGLFGRVEYMLRGTGARLFKLAPIEGKIIVNDCGYTQCIDYEIQPSFSLTYEAKDGGGRTRNVSVIINVIDINDHAPKFTEMVYKRELLSDNLSSKQNYISPQLIVRAKDGDGPTQGRNNITYRIKSSNLTNLDVDPVSGLVYFSQPLDLDSIIMANNADDVSNNPEQVSNSALQQPAELKRIVFEAEVVAEDNGRPMLNSSAKILLVVKGNRDGAPQFRQDFYRAYVRENQPVNKAFFQVQAIDPDEKDSQLRYSLGFDLNDLININPMSGELSFKTKVDYDDFKDTPYNVTVYATDNSRPHPLRASAQVSILVQDVNDKFPQFREREYRATLIQGHTRRGDRVMMVSAVDLDKNAKLNYSLISDQMFVHDRNGLQLSLNDLANSTAGYLAQMSQKERQQLVWQMRRLFQIDKQTGAIELRHEPDYSFAASITIQIRVQDLNQEIFIGNEPLQVDTANCTFFLQTHIDKAPIFAPPWSIDRRDYSLSILEELPVGTTIFSLLAKDPRTSQRIDIFEKILESDPKDYFRVERTSGIVYVNRRVDYEELSGNKRLSLSVKALTEDNYFSIANMYIQVIDLNDNAPLFKSSSNYSVSISESATYPQEVFQVVAEDRDSNEYGQVYYSLSAHSSELFTIDSKRGTISVKKGAKLDRDTEPNHSLFVTASDCSSEPMMSHSSTSTPSSVVIAESQLVADPRINSGNQGCKKSSVVVSVSLLDENDNDPVFKNLNKRGELECLVSETASIGAEITQIEAADSDEGPNGQVAYELVSADEQINRLIKIDPHKGYLSVADSLAGLGRPTPYKLTIRAYDHGKQPNVRQAYATLLLTISDVVSNDGVPRFVRPRPDEVVLLSESVGPSTFVYQVQAVDPDEETNGKLMYKFSQQSDMFEIDPFTGIIKTQYRPRFNLDREQVPNYTLIIVAQDLGTPRKEAHQVLTIKITDVNDNEPYFERGIDDPPLVLLVEEELPKDTLIGSIQAIDRDIEQNAMIGYEIIEGNQKNLFRLDYEEQKQQQQQQLNDTSQQVAVVSGNNPCKIYSTGRLDRELKESYTLTIKATSASKLRNPFIHQLRDPLGHRNPFNQYNASDLTKIRVTIKLLDINDNRPMFLQQNPKSVVDSSAEIYSQLLVFKAQDADSSNSEMQYSILDVLYYTDSKFRFPGAFESDLGASSSYHAYGGAHHQGSMQPVSMSHVFDIDQRSGILRNSVSLRPYIDGYFEVYVKADSGLYNQIPSAKEVNDELSFANKRLNSAQYPSESQANNNKCFPDSNSNNQIGSDGQKQITNSSSLSSGPFGEMENCYVAVSKAVVFITHQRETFRFVFNKTKLNDRLDEFKSKIQNALEEIMFEPSQAQASSDPSASLRESSSAPSNQPKADKIYLNTFNTDFYEREDGSLDFSTLTSCSQLVKFDDRSSQMVSESSFSSQQHNPSSSAAALSSGNTIVPNQVINYEEVLQLLKTLNQTQLRQQKTSLFSQYGLVSIERCLQDRTMYRMSLSERCSIYFAIAIAVIGVLLAFIVSQMRKSYEKNLKLLQRSKYQYMSPYSTLAPAQSSQLGSQLGSQQQLRPHHMSLGTLAGSTNFIAPTYGSHLEFDRAAYDTWQM